MAAYSFGRSLKDGNGSKPLRQMAENLLLGHLVRSNHHILTVRPERKFVENPLFMKNL